MKWAKLSIFNKQLFKLAAFRGEWWIADGRAEFADGDIGDKNHEAVVIETVQRQWADDEFSMYEMVDWEGFENSLFEEAVDEKGLNREEIHDPEPFVYEALKQRGMSDEEILVARGQGTRIDIRGYAMKTWGWKSVHGNYITSWTLTPKDLKEIADGLWDAETETSEEELFTLESQTTHKTFTEVPLGIIALANPQALAEYAKNPNFREMIPQ